MPKRLLYSSYHNYLDGTSGAAVSTRETLLELSRQGWEVKTFCGSFFDGKDPPYHSLSQSLATHRLQPQFEKYQSRVNGQKVTFQLVRFNDSGIESAVFLPEDAMNSAAGTVQHLSFNSGSLFLKMFGKLCRSFHPDVYASYGGYWAADIAAKTARETGAVNVFLLHNLSYRRARLFTFFDSFVTPSHFAKAYYQKELSVEPEVVPPLIDEFKVIASTNTKRFLTFINPSVEKGFLFFLGIVRELNRTGADVPCLIVENRARTDALQSILKSLKLRNVFVSSHVAEPRLFYSQSRILLVPSLCEETFGRVAVEASLNGIPVLCSNRGALPEVVDGSCRPGNLVLPIDKKFTVSRRLVPNSEDVELWKNEILHLWYDCGYWESVGSYLKERSRCFRQATVAKSTGSFYARLLER